MDFGNSKNPGIVVYDLFTVSVVCSAGRWWNQDCVIHYLRSDFFIFSTQLFSTQLFLLLTQPLFSQAVNNNAWKNRQTIIYNILTSESDNLKLLTYSYL